MNLFFAIQRKESLLALGINILGAIATKGIGALSGIIITWTLSQQEFGTVALINSLLMIAPLLLHLGLRQAFWLEAMHLGSDARKELLNTIILLYTGISASMISLLYLTGILNRCCQLLHSPAVTVLLLSYCYLQFFSELYLVILRQQRKTLLLTTLQILSGCVTLVGNLFLTGWLGWSVIGVLLANTIGVGVIVMFSALLYLQQGIYQQINTTHLQRSALQLMRLGLPFVPNILLYWLMTGSTKWFLALYTTTETVAIYAFAEYAPQLITQLLAQPIITTYIPTVVARYQQMPITIVEQENRTIVWYLNIAVLACISCTAAISYAVAPFVLPLWCKPGILLMVPLSCISLASLNYQLLTTIIAWQKKTTIMLSITIVAACFHLASSWILIYYGGIYGAALATVVTSVLYTAVTWHVNNRLTT